MGLLVSVWAWLGARRTVPAWLVVWWGVDSGSLMFGVAAVPEHPNFGFNGLAVNSEAGAKGY